MTASQSLVEILKNFFVSNLLLLLAGIGLTLIVKYGFILQTPREWVKNKARFINPTFGLYIEKLLSCAQCLGFWCGFFIFLLNSLSEQSYDWIILYSTFFGFATSFLSNSLDMMLTLLDERIFQLQRENESTAKKD
jgi:hypothetical protein